MYAGVVFAAIALRSPRVRRLIYVTREPTHAEYGELRRFIQRRVPSREAADEITQDVFLSVASTLACASKDSPRTLGWLYVVARRRIIDHARRAARAHAPVLDAVAEPRSLEADYGPEVARTLSSALARLSEAQRTVVVLRLLRGESFARIAKRLRITEEACRMRFMRGLEQIRDDFEEEGLTP